MVQGVEIDLLGSLLIFGKETKSQMNVVEKSLKQYMIEY